MCPTQLTSALDLQTAETLSPSIHRCMLAGPETHPSPTTPFRHRHAAARNSRGHAETLVVAEGGGMSPNLRNETPPSQGRPFFQSDLLMNLAVPNSRRAAAGTSAW